MTTIHPTDALRSRTAVSASRLAWVSLVAAASLGCATNAAPTADESEFSSSEFEQALGECTSTTQCKSMYGERAVDCARSAGGFCLCGPDREECAAPPAPVPPPNGTGASCQGDGTCPADHYCNVNQGSICTPDRSAGSVCSRNAQCVGECVNKVCVSSEPSLGPSDPNNPAVYTGQSHWRASTGTLTLLSSGTLPNGHDGWTVPSAVKTLVVGTGVRATGRLNVRHSMTIEGKNRKSSEFFGTPEVGYNKKNDGCGLCKSMVLGEGNITVTVKNLTSRNPFGFHFTGKSGAKFLIDAVDAIDDRGGHGNNSDGVSAASGTIVRNSFFSTGDDVIKVYADILVEDTTIEMVTNTVPIQFGWGDYGSGAKGTFKNLTVYGDSGRGADDNALISARKGRYDKTIVIDGLDFQNPNAAFFIARESSGNASITVTNALIDIEKFRGHTWNMNVTSTICGTTYRNGQGAPADFDCRH